MVTINTKHQATVLSDPLQIPKILQKILDFVPISSLKTCREVSPLWRREGGRLLLWKTWLDLQSWANLDDLLIEKNTQLLSDFLKSSGGAKIRLKIYAASPATEIIQEIPEFGQRITCLKYCSWIEESEELANFFILLPSLRVLQTNTLNISPGQKWIKKSKGCQFSNFLDKLNFLREIHLNFDLTKSLLQDFNLPDNLEKLRNIQITSIRFHCLTGNVIQTFLNSPVAMSWPIRKLRLWFSTQTVQPEVVQKLLMGLSSTLQNLHIRGFSKSTLGSNVSNADATYENFLKSLENWFLPPAPGLEKLTSLKIGGKSPVFIQRTLNNALRWPNLRRLRLEKIPDLSKSSCVTWTTCDSLEELEIGTSDGASLSIDSLGDFPGHLWPNLRSLKIRAFLDGSSPEPDFTLPFDRWTQLERLELEILPEKCGTASVGENQLDKIHNLVLGEKSTRKNENSSHVSGLKDLENLKHLSLHCSSRFEEENENLQFESDILIRNCFRFMKNLQSLHLINLKVSSSALEMLKGALGPNFSVQVTEEEDDIILHGL